MVREWPTEGQQQEFQFGIFIPGVVILAPFQLTYTFVAPWTGVVKEVIAHINTAPTVTSLVLDVLRNGASIFPAMPPPVGMAILATTTDAFQLLAVPFQRFDLFTFDINQVGGGVPGSDLTIEVRAVRE